MRVKACLAGAHLSPTEEWKWAYVAGGSDSEKSAPPGRKTDCTNAEL